MDSRQSTRPQSATPYELLLEAAALPPSPTSHSHPPIPLPSSSRHARTRSIPSFHRARSRTVITLAAVPIALCSLAVLCYHFVFRFYLADEFVYGLPDVPDYDEYSAWEDALPQHNASVNRRYLMFSNQATGYGLNNQLQEVLLLSHISWMAQRAYVFQPYVWDAKSKSKAVLDGRNWRSARIPLSVFVSGPTAGGQFAEGDPSPRAVTANWWEEVCPVERRRVVDVAEEHARWNVDRLTQGGELADRWAAMLRGIPDPCVEITGPTIFDFALIASPRILSVWPSLSVSPILTRFAWSNLITAAVLRNIPLFHDTPAPSLPDSPPRLPDSRRRAVEPIPRDTYNSNGRNRRPPSPNLSSLAIQSSSEFSSTNSSSSPTIKGLIAVHLRRGDFKMHCHWLADRTEPFAGWNQFPFLLDRFSTPSQPTTGDVLGRKKVHDTYVSRCWPEVAQVVDRLREVRRLHPGLERVFVLTNGKKAWVDALKRALMQAGESEESETTTAISTETGVVHVQPVPPATTGKGNWKAVFTSKDLDLLWTEREIDQAVDMELARRAEVFLGNGFSSLTSNIVMLRLSDSTPIENIRFW